MWNLRSLKEYHENLQEEQRRSLRILNPGLSLKAEEEAGQKAVRRYLFAGAFGIALLLISMFLSFRKVSFSEELSLLGIMVIAFAVFLRFRLSDRIRKRRESIEDDYPLLVMSLAGLMISGYNVQNAWHRLAEDYSASMKGLSVREYRKRMRYAYEELVLTDRKIRRGESEIEAYREYARIMGSRQYLRLSELLEQFVRTGRSDVYELWNLEHTQALTEKKNRMSEKASRRESALVLPMVILLGMIMAMILVPAMMSF